MWKWRKCGNHDKPCFVFPHFTSSLDLQSCVKRYSTGHIYQFQESALLLPAQYTYSARKKNTSHPCPLACFLQRCLTTSTLNRSVTKQVSGNQKQKTTPFHPSWHVVLFLLVYGAFRRWHESWIQLAAWSYGMTSDRAGSHRPGSSREGFQSVKIVLITNLRTGSDRNFKPFFFFFGFGEWNVLFFFVLFYLKNPESLSVEDAPRLFSLDERSICPLWSDPVSSRLFQIAGTQAVFSLPAVRPLLLLYYCFCISCYY